MLGFYDYIDVNVLCNMVVNINLIFMFKLGKDIILFGELVYDGKLILCIEMGGIFLEGVDGDRKDFWGYYKVVNLDELFECIKGVVDVIIDGGIC